MTKEENSKKFNRQYNYRKRMKEKGYYWLSHWVPLEFKEKVKAYAKKLRSTR